MNYLLDTHLLIWFLTMPEKIPRFIENLMEVEPQRIVFSSVGIWETAIKYALRRSDFPIAPNLLRDTLLSRGLTLLPITDNHAIAVATLPPIHRDPFDRLLLAQAIVENFTLITTDATIAQYPGPVLRV